MDNRFNGNKIGSPFTHEERVANGRKGGIASGVAKRRKKAMRDTISTILSMPVKNTKNSKKKTAEQIKSLEEVKGANVDVETAILLAITKKAMNGDVIAATFIRDTLGENPYIVAQQELENKNGNDEHQQISDATNIVFRARENNIYNEQQEEVMRDDANAADGNTESENN
ncbi:MAG: hypothetical protein J6R47_03515 [Acholeplasmatales bacterium]|nr:hypothetical protein [Acholeplasmatales bacterium]